MIAPVVEIQAGHQGDFLRLLGGDVRVEDLQAGQFQVVKDDRGIGRQPELDFELIQALPVVAHGVDPGRFGIQFTLPEQSQGGLSFESLLGQGALALDIEFKILKAAPTVPHGIFVLEDSVIRGGDLDAEIAAKTGEIAQRIEQGALGLRQVFQRCFPGAAPERLNEGRRELGGSKRARIPGEKAREIRRESGGELGAGFEQPIGAGQTLTGDPMLFDQGITQLGLGQERDRINHDYGRLLGGDLIISPLGS